jgi:16S rRNA (adenine1518-N6/adenine1519-N6)-dimethyltransferase
VRPLFETARHRARRRFGQNFLVEPVFVRRIVEAIDPRPGDRLVEIGPGLGALTAALLDRVERLTAIEIDRDLAARLRSTYPPERLELHVADALGFDFARAGSGLRVVGNLPYNISSPLLFALLDCAERVRDVHVMLQREVVERMSAPPGGRAYGRLTVMLAYRFAIERLFYVPAGAFRPRPQVESAFVRLTRLEPRPWQAADEALFRRIVAAAFSQRRKTLRNALAKVVREETMRELGIDPQVRAETLSVAQYVQLANAAGKEGAESVG